MRKLYIFFLFSGLLISCDAKVVRPKLTGTVVDEKGNPLENCQVGASYTNKNGNYVLEEIINKGFITPFGSAPIFISEVVSKKGYEPKELIGGTVRGGISKGTVWKMDTIRLRKRIGDFSEINLKDTWLASMTKNRDTVFLTKKNQEHDQSKIDFIANYQDTLC